MRKLLNLICGIAISITSAIVQAQNCDIPIRVISSPQVENIPETTLEMLNSRLATAVTADGISSSVPYGQFFITAKFNHITEDVVPGPPKQFAVHSYLTLLIGDIEGKQIYCSKTFELRGVGTSTQRALSNSLQPISAQNSNFEDFLNVGRNKIINYYNTNFSTILAKANKAASLRHYDEALYYACSIPECCNGFSQASDDIVKIFQSYIDNDSQMLYQKAYAAWSKSPNYEGAQVASLYISLIDPSSSVHSKAQQLADDIKKTVRNDFVFDKQTKYKDSISLQKAYIDAARQIGIAYGNGQKESTTNLLWIK